MYMRWAQPGRNPLPDTRKESTLPVRAVQARSLAATTLIESLRISGTPHAVCDCGLGHYSGGAIALRARDRECWLLDEQSGGGKRVRVLMYTAGRKRPLCPLFRKFPLLGHNVRGPFD